jgi:hypothetical protein
MAAWGVEELHATELALDQRLEVARFIQESDSQLLAHVTDTVLVAKNGIAEFRLGQAARLKRNLDWYRRESTKARGAPVPEIEEWYLRHIKRAGLASQVSHGEFVQALYLVELIIDAVQKALLLYHEDRWRDDFEDFNFVLDAKLPTKMAAGEKYLNDSLVPALGSRPGEGLVLARIVHQGAWCECSVRSRGWGRLRASFRARLGCSGCGSGCWPAVERRCAGRSRGARRAGSAAGYLWGRRLVQAGGGSVLRRPNAAARSAAQGQLAWRRRRAPRAWNARRAATCSSR